MRMRLGRKGDYAVRAMVDLTRYEGQGLRKTREIAEEMAIPMTYLPQILARLVAVGLATSVAGPGGGYALARPSGEIRLLDVIDAMEEAGEPPECVLVGGPCRWETECAVHRFWWGAQEAFREQLHDATLADVGAVDAELAGPAG